MKKMTIAALALFACLLPSASFAADASAGQGNDYLCTQWGCLGGSATLSFSDWHGTPDGNWPSTFGPALGIELASPIPGLQDYGLGAQATGSYGQYQLNGRDVGGTQTNQQREHFYSLGLFRRPSLDGPWYSRFGAGLTYDIAIQDTFGDTADDVYLRQWRLKSSYSINQNHEVGAWMSIAGPTAYAAQFPNATSTQYRALGQLDFYYKHRFEQGGHLTVFYGPGIGGALPTFDGPVRYNGIKWVLGGEGEAPLNDYLSVYASTAWGDPNVATGTRTYAGADTSTWNVTAGLRVFWGGNARGRDDSGKRWMPYLPAPDNGNFMIESNYVQ